MKSVTVVNIFTRPAMLQKTDLNKSTLAVRCILEQGNAAIMKIFWKVSDKPAEVKKKQAVQLLKSLNPGKLVNGVKKEAGHSLEVLFSTKTHKPNIPFQTIVSETLGFRWCLGTCRRTWNPLLLPTTSLCPVPTWLWNTLGTIIREG